MAFKYSVVLTTLALAGGNVWEKPREVLGMIADLGFDAVDLDAEPSRIESREFNKVVDTVRAMGLEVGGLLGAWGSWHANEQRDLTSSDDRVRGYAVDYVKQCIDLSASIGGPVYQFGTVAYHMEYPVSSIPRETLRSNFVRSVSEIGEYAAKRDVPVAIEPLNKFEGYAGFMNTAGDALSVIEEVNQPTLGVLVDFFHANIEDQPLCDVLRMVGDKLLHIHLADSNRQAPGAGHIDFLDVVRTLTNVGYSHYLSLDCIPPKPDLQTFLERSLSYMKELEKVVALQRQLYQMY